MYETIDHLVFERQIHGKMGIVQSFTDIKI